MATGATGYIKIGNVIINWGGFTASAAGVVNTFRQPYVDNAITVIPFREHTAGVIGVQTSITGWTGTAGGAATGHYIAIGS